MGLVWNCFLCLVWFRIVWEWFCLELGLFVGFFFKVSLGLFGSGLFSFGLRLDWDWFVFFLGLVWRFGFS